MNQHLIQARNIRVLLWRERYNRDKWVAMLASWLGSEIRRAHELLNKGGLTAEEGQRLSDATGQPLEELLQGDLLSGIDVLCDNIQYLLSTLEHGEQQEVARKLGVDTTTVSRWRSGRLKNPTPRNLDSIKRWFEIPAHIDLSKDPLFLDLEPLVLRERREWLISAIRNLEPSKLNQYFPVLRRLLGE